MKQSDREHLLWIYGRLVNYHGENKNVDYMKRFESIIAIQEVTESPEPKLTTEQRIEYLEGAVQRLLNK
jgi:hypothetical protein